MCNHTHTHTGLYIRVKIKDIFADFFVVVAWNWFIAKIFLMLFQMTIIQGVEQWSVIITFFFINNVKFTEYVMRIEKHVLVKKCFRIGLSLLVLVEKIINEVETH